MIARRCASPAGGWWCSDRSVVVSVGGYASLPATLAARSLRIPVVVVSYDRTARPSESCSPPVGGGVRSRLPDSRAARAPRSPARRCGVPCSPSTASVAGMQHGAALGIDDDRFLVAVTGGSLGSAAVNEAIAAYVAETPRRHRPRRASRRRRAVRRRGGSCPRREATASATTSLGSMPTCRSPTPLPTCSSAAVGRAPSPRLRSRGSRRSSSRGRVPPRTIRRRTCAGSPTRVPPFCVPDAEVTRLGEEIDAAASRRRPGGLRSVPPPRRLGNVHGPAHCLR